MKESVKSSVSAAPDHADLSVYRLVGGNYKRVRRRKSYFIVGLSPNVNYNVYNSDIDAVERAAKERLFYVKDVNGRFVEPIKPSLGTFTEICGKFRDLFYEHVHIVSPLTKDQFLRAYVGRKRTVYEKAFKSLESQPLVRKDSFVNFFMKVEKLNFSLAKDHVPRGISPRTPRYHVMLGLYIKRIEKKVYKIISELFGSRPVVCKGMNAQQRGKVISDHWRAFPNPVAIPIDAARFDQHCSLEALRFEHTFYEMFFNDKYLSRLLRWQRDNKGYAYTSTGKLKFRLKRGRMSGDMNTALGNCLLMCCMVYTVMEKLGFLVDDYRFVDDGDDGVIIMDQSNVRKLRNLHCEFLPLGFNVVVEKMVTVLEEIEFCQSRPIQTESGVVMVRSVPVSMAKDCLSIKPLDSQKVFEKWMAAVGEGGMALAGQVPILQDFYQAFYRSSNGAKPLTGDPTQETGMVMLAKGMKRCYGRIAPITRFSFWKAFGIDPHKQEICEKAYKQMIVDYSTLNDLHHLTFALL
jgi:hypothetical protein